MKLDELRRFYAEEIRAVSNIQNNALVEAFARVPREQYQCRALLKLKCAGQRFDSVSFINQLIAQFHGRFT